MSTTVSIGRNLPLGGKLPEDDWQRFVADLVRITRAFCGEIYFAGFGNGTYIGTEEESFTLIAEDVSYCIRERYEDSLCRLAARHGQEAIALTVGRTQFLYANSPVH